MGEIIGVKYLTKTNFKKGIECPIKLTSDYKLSDKSNDFLSALADGGFQAEELSRLHFKDGILINGSNHLAVSKTNELLKKGDCVIYEAAFLNDNLFVKTDILVKSGNLIKVIEVKAKSFDSSEKKNFTNTNGSIRREWKPYLFDLAFQTSVIQKCFPDYEVESYLMLADKSKKASVDGLNQLFQMTSKNTRTGIDVKVNSIAEIGDPIMEEVNLTQLILSLIHI